MNETRTMKPQLSSYLFRPEMLEHKASPEEKNVFHFPPII